MNKVIEFMLESEMAALQSLDHPHLTSIFFAGEDEKNYYIVMEIVNSGTLEQYMKKAY